MPGVFYLSLSLWLTPSLNFVVYKGFIPAHVDIAIRRQAHKAFPLSAPLPACYGLATKKSYSYPSKCAGQKSSLSSMDSDLEAFSHNPADGSFAALPDQTAAKTNYSNERFLSY
ncbi:unnamed protein product [Candida parapsilosis]